MKIFSSNLVVISIILTMLGSGAALVCWTCKNLNDCNDPIEDSKLSPLDCSSPAPAPGGTNDSGTAAPAPPGAEASPPPAEASKQEAPATTEAASLLGLLGVRREASIDITAELGCIKLVSVQDGKTSIMRGCGSETCDVTKLLTGDKNATCHHCKTEKCNSSVRINPIGWIYVLIAMICIGLRY